MKLKKGEITQQYNIFKRLHNVELSYSIYYTRKKDGYSDDEILEILKVGYKIYLAEQKRKETKIIADRMKNIKEYDLNNKTDYKELCENSRVDIDPYYLVKE